jgi:hypothetical protein
VVHPHPNAKIELETEFFAQTALAEARTHSVLAATTLKKQTWHMTHLGEWLRVENEVLAYETPNTAPEGEIKYDIHESGRWRGTSHLQECFLPRDLEAQGVA